MTRVLREFIVAAIEKRGNRKDVLLNAWTKKFKRNLKFVFYYPMGLQNSGFFFTYYLPIILRHMASKADWFISILVHIEYALIYDALLIYIQI